MEFDGDGEACVEGVCTAGKISTDLDIAFLLDTERCFWKVKVTDMHVYRFSS